MSSNEDGPTLQAVNLVEDLKSQVHKAEAACEQYRNQLAILQERLDDALRVNDKEEDRISELQIELEASQANSAKNENLNKQRIQELEETLLGAQISIAKPTDDKKSYQVVLGDKTPGCATNDANHASASESPARFPELDRIQQERTMQLEDEVQSLKEQNTALTLYINKIVTRLLQHESFEGLFQNGSTGPEQQLNTIAELQRVDTALAALPSPQSELHSEYVAGKENHHPPQSTLLKRAGSVFGGKTRSRPTSVLAEEDRNHTSTSFEATDTTCSHHTTDTTISSRPPNNPNEDMTTSMKIPLRRAESRRRPAGPSAEWRGPPSSSSRHSSGQVSPGVPVHRQTSYFGTVTHSDPLSKDPSTVATETAEGIRSQYGSRSASESGYTELPTSMSSHQYSATNATDASMLGSLPSSSSPASSISSDIKPPPTVFNSGNTAATPNRMRPLRLVQEKREADDAALAELKKANRSSWMGGWFAGGSGGAPKGDAVGVAGVVSKDDKTTQAQWPGPKPGAGGAGGVGSFPKKSRVGSGVYQE